MTTEVLFDGSEQDSEVSELIRLAMGTTLNETGAHGNVTVMVTDAESIRTLNRTYRGIDRVTDVLTFPAWEGDAILCPPDGYLGDVAICMPRAVEQAEAFGHSLRRELAFLTVHGALHLSGYDHMTPEDERAMFAKQEEILTGMGITR